MRFIKLMILFVLAVLFGTVANAADKDNNPNATSVPASKTDVPKASAADGKGPWIGVIEDIQDVDTTAIKQAEIDKMNNAPSAAKDALVVARTVVGAVVDAFTATPGQMLAGHTIGEDIAHWRIPVIFTIFGSHGTEVDRDDPRAYLVFFKDENTNKIEKVFVYDVICWNVGDKIKLSRNLEDPSKVDITVVEMGELSRYAAERAAERDK